MLIIYYHLIVDDLKTSATSMPLVYCIRQGVSVCRYLCMYYITLKYKSHDLICMCVLARMTSMNTMATITSGIGSDDYVPTLKSPNFTLQLYRYSELVTTRIKINYFYKE